MTVIGSASINIRADDKYFEPDVRRAVAKIKDLRVALKVDADMSAANKKLRDLRYRMSQNEVQIKIRANDVSFEADVRAAVRKIKNVTIDLKADVDSSKASKKIRDLRYRITSKPAILKVDANVAKAEEKMRKLLEKFTESTVNITAKAHTGEAHTALSDLQTRYGKNVNYTATADTKVARAALALVARNRRAKITAFIDPATGKALQGLFNTITGTLPFDKIKSSIVGVVASFEALVIKTTAVGAALLSVGALALTAGANIFSIAGDITQVVGIAAMLPAAFIAMGVGIAATKMAWKGFGEALSSDPKKAAKAMAELPPEAQAAADSVRGLGKEIQKATQAKFWEALGTSLQDMVTNLLPQLKEGFEYVGTAIGTLQAATFDSISKSLGDGVLLGILTNVGDMFSNMTKGVGDFIQGITTLGSVGATYLPQFGTYLSDAGTKFGEFIRKADEAGKINVWIETAVRRFQELGSIVKSTTSIMTGLTEIARFSGAPGLTQMADGFRNVANVVNSEPFQSQLRVILEGARAGTEALGQGLGTLTQLFWDSSDSIGAFLKLAGEIAGLTFENITKLFDGTGLGTGLYEALQGFKDGMGELGPAFRDMGTAIGDLGRIAGELFRSMAPGLNMLAETIAGVVGGLTDGIIDAMPIFNEFAQAILGLASGPLIALAQGVGAILTTFSELPGAVQTVIMSLGLLLLLKPKFDKFFGGMTANLAKDDSRIGNFFRNVSDNASTTMRGVTSATEGTGTAIRRVFSDSGRSASAMFGTMAKEADTAAGRVSSTIGRAAAATTTALRPVRAGFKEALMVDGDLNRVGDKLSETSGRVTAFAKEQGSRVKSQFSEMANHSSARMTDIGNSAKTSFGKISGFAGEQVGLAKRQFADMGRAVDHSLAYIPSRAATAFSGVATSAADTARGTVGAFKDTGTQIGKGLGTINGHIRRVAGQVNTDLAPARAAFTNLVTHAATAGKAAGASLGGGIATAAKGLSGALGGPWGLAIAGATVAVAAWAQAQAASKARVEALTDVIGKQAGKLGEAGAKMLTNNLMDGATTKWDDFWRGAIKGSKSVEESFDTLGVSLGDVGKKLADSSSREAYAKGWDDITQSISRGGKPTQSMLTAIGLTNEQLARLSKQDIQHINSQLQGVAEEAEKAEIAAKHLADAHGVAGVMGARLSANYEVLGNATSSVSDKTSAFKDNLDILSKGQMTALEASSRYHDTLRSTNEQLTALNVNNEGGVAGLLTQAGAFDVTTAAGNDLYKAMSASKDSIIDMGIAVMQNSIDSGKSMSVAKAEAVSSMLASTGTLKQSLVDLGIDAGVAQGLLDTLGLNEEKLTGALVMNTEEANFAIAQSALAANAYANGEYAAALSALPQAAKDAILGVEDYLQAYKDGGWEAVLTAIDKTGGVSSEVISSLIAATGDAEYMAYLEATDLTPAAFNSIVAAGARLDESDFSIDLTAEDLTAAGFEAAANRLDTWEELKEVELTLKDGTTVPLHLASQAIQDQWYNSPYGQMALRAIDETEGGVSPAMLNVKSFAEMTGNELKLGAVDNTDAGIMQALDNAHYKYKLTPDEQLALETLDKTDAGLLAAKMKVDGEWVTAPDAILDLVTKNNAAQGITGARDQVINEWLNVPANRDLITKNAAGGGIMEATSEVDAKWKGLPSMVDLLTQNKAAEGINSSTGSVMSKWVNNPDNKLGLFTEDKAMPGVMSVKNTVENGLAGVGGAGGGMSVGMRLPISVEDLAAEGTASAANTMATGVTDQHRSIWANNNTVEGTAAAQGTMGGLTDVWRGLFGVNNTGAATGEAQGTMSTLGDVWRGLFASNNTGDATGSAQGTMNTLQNVMRELQATNATGGATAASQSTMNSLQNVMRALQAQNSTGAATAASQSTMNSLRNVIRQLEAQNAASGGTAAAQSTMNGLRDVERELRARNRAGEGVSAAQGVINSLVGKTVDVVTRFFKIGDNADGGLWGGDGTRVMAQGGIMKSANNSAVQAFANGGINRGAQQQAIKAFAGGGIENHTAQIARGAWPVRIWAEPETGGEAYIPLSPNKRKRSLAILKQVMSEFGLEHLTHSFADGGINKAQRYSTPTVISSRYAAASTGSVSPAAQPTTQAAAPVIHVHPSQGLNEEQIGVIASDRLWFNIQNSSF